MTALEENRGSEGNSSVAELEQRVETLEGTAEDHETRISSTESNMIGNTSCINLFQSNYNILIQQRMTSSQRKNFEKLS